MLKDFQALLHTLGNAEFQAVLLGPFIVFALFFGTVLFLAFFATKDAKGQVAALALIVLGGLSVVPLDKAHRDSGPRVQAVTGLEKAGYAHKKWADSRPLFLGIAVLGTVTLFFGRSNKLGLTCTVVTILAGFALSAYALWLVYQEARVFHPNLKSAATHAPAPAAHFVSGTR